MSGLEVREGRHAARRPEVRASRRPFARLWSPTARLVEALVLLLALNLWATPADGAAAQGPAPVAPVPAQLLGSPCPPGSTQQSLVVWGCYPCSTNPGAPNCGTCTTCPNQTELDDLDWGFGTAPDEIICVDKFDPGLGSLTSVQVEAFMDFEGKVCIYNSGTECCEQPYDFTAIATLNVDEYAGSDLLSSPIVWDVFANDNQSLPGTSIKLAPSNGAPDCGLMMSDPTLANTSCVNDTGARDTRVFEWSVLDQAAARQLIDPSLNPADQVILDNWVAASAGERAKLSTVADGQVQLLSNCPVTVNYAENPILRGRKRIKVTYTYCTNAAPTCVPPATPYEVDENSTPASNNSVVINLLDLVTDVDGCIDCSTFQITQQPGFAAPLAASCTGLGDLVNPDPACTSCTNCVITYTPTPGVGFCGVDSFKFLVQDDFGASVECEVFVTVNPVNDPPVCDPPAAPLPAVEDGSIVIDFCQYLSDPDEATGCGLGIDCDSIGTPTSDCGGTFTPLGAGQYRFRPPMDFCGQCTITFSGADLGGLPSGDCQLVVDVAPVNDPPICNTPGGPPQIIFEDEPQVFDLSQWVLDPDAGTGCGAGDLDCSTLTFSTSSPELVAVAGPGPCEVTLSGLPDQCGGPYTLFFNIADTAGAPIAQDCQVRFRIGARNDPPTCVANPPVLQVQEDTPVTFNICDWVEDIDAPTNCGNVIDPSTLVLQGSSCGGTLENLGGCQVRFTPPADFCGPCSIDFTISDVGGLSVSCTVDFVVDPVNDPPVCVTGPALAPIPEGGSVDIDFTQYVEDPDEGSTCGAGLDVSSITPSSDCGGSFAPLGGGVFRYTAAAGTCGPCTISFTVTDLGGLPVTAPCPIPLEILAVNEPPVCVPGPALGSIPEGGSVDIDFKLYVQDPDEGSGCGAGLDVSSIAPSSSCGGSFTPLGDGVFRFDAPAGFCGPCTISFTAADLGTPPLSVAAPCPLPLTVDPVNEPPVCVPGPALRPINEGTSIVIDFTLYVADPDDATGCGAGLDVSSITPSSDCGGTFTPQGGGVFTFTPTPGTCGTCTLSVTASDLAGLTVAAPCPIPLEVLPVNDPPVCVAGPTLPPVPEGGSIIIDFKQYVSDPDDGTGCGDGLDVSSITPSTDCDAVFVPLANGRFRFRPALGSCGPCTITFTAADLGGLQVAAPCPIPVTIDPVNEAPECVAGPVVPSIPEGGSVDIDLTQYVVDPDDLTGCGDGLDVGSFSASTDCGGTVTDLGGGLVRFTPAAGFCGPCTISFTVNDLGGLPLGAPCPIPLEVLGQNTPPVAADDTATTNEDTPVVIDVIANDFDADDGGTEGCGCTLDSSTIQITSFDPDCVQSEPAVFFDPGLGRFAVRLVPAPDYCGPCVFTYEVSDSDGRGVPCSTSNQATVTVTIDPVNDPPIAEDDFAVTQVDTPVLIDLCLNDSDPDAETGCGCLLDCSTIEILDSPSACGTLELDPGGTGLWLYTPAPDFEGECCFTYRVFDSDGGVPCDSATAQVCIEVNRFCPPTNLRNPASLLLYPEFDNRPGMLTIHTVTNSSDADEVDVHFEFVGAETCERSNRSETLTPNDTFTFATGAWIAEQVRGYSYVYASCDPAGNEPVVFNYLTGGVLVMDGFDGIAYSMNAIAFRGIGVTREGETAGVGGCEWPRTDLNGNGHRDLDAMEYDPVPDEILIPRFLGQTAERQSELILIALTGGKKFDTQLDFLIYNDNEQVFSRQYEFYCWERTPLEQISALFRNEFLAGQTDNNPLEVLGNPTVESGWIRIDGGVATSTSTSIEDPAFYAILVEKHAPTQMAADLPFGSDCPNLNGRLLPGTLTGE